MHLLTSSRRARAAIALTVAMCLVAFMLVTNNRERQLHYQMTLKVSSLYWKMSELFYESNAAVSSMRQYKAGEETVKHVQTRIDLLWSRLNSFERTHIGLNDNLVEEFGKLRFWLEAAEREFFNTGPPDQQNVTQLIDRLNAITTQIRATWIDTYLADRRGIAATTLDRMETRAETYTVLTLGCIAILIIYLIAELHFATRAQLEESKLREAALEGARAKTRFLSRISHEIRTPLNGIVGMAQDLGTTRLTSEQRQSVDVIKDASATLLNMINNVLEIAAMETGKSPVRHVPIDISGLVDHVIRAYGPLAKEKSIMINDEGVKRIRRIAEGDPERLVAAFGHVLSGAIKYFENAEDENTEIYVSAELNETDKADPTLVFKVEHRNRLELPEPCSEMADDPTDYVFLENDAAGLDLSLASQICSLMNGRLSSETMQHGHYNVTCEIPVRLTQTMTLADLSEVRVPGVADGAGEIETRAEPLSQPASTSGNTPGSNNALKVLIVDDSATNRLVLRKLLQDSGVQFSEVDDGAKAVKDCEDHAYDVVLMDIQMPVLNGIEATKRIREMERATRRPKIKIMAITANVLPQQVDEYYRVGMDDVLAKPLNKLVLLSRLRALIGAEQCPGESAAVASDLPEIKQPSWQS